MSSERINWRIHLIEFLIVTLGILIGFGLNSCNESRKEKKQVQLYLKGIKEELIANKKELNEVHPYHLGLLKKLGETPSDVNLVLSPGEITNSAWRLAENTIFKKHIDPAIYKELAAVYKIHDYLMEESSQASQLMGEANVLGTFYVLPAMMGREMTEEDGRDIEALFKQGWIPIFESWTSKEKDYLEQIDLALASLE